MYLSDYLPLHKDNVNLAIEALNYNMKEYKKTHANESFFEYLLYFKQAPKNEDHKPLTFLEDMLSIETIDSIEDLYLRSFLFTSCFERFKFNGLDTNILKKNAYPIFEKLSSNSKLVPLVALREDFKREQLQNTLVDLYHTHLSHQHSRSLEDFYHSIKTATDNGSDTKKIWNEFVEPLSFNSLREIIGSFALVKILSSSISASFTMERETYLVDFFDSLIQKHPDIYDHDFRETGIHLISDYVLVGHGLLDKFVGNVKSANIVGLVEQKDIPTIETMMTYGQPLLQVIELYWREQMFNFLLPYQEKLMAYENLERQLPTEKIAKPKNKI